MDRRSLARITIIADESELFPIAAAPVPRPARLPRRPHALVMVLACLLAARAVLIEPFGVATGSMAPTLLGLHRDAVCPHCGAALSVGVPSDGPAHRAYWAARCPQCGGADLGLEDAPDVAGDRVLVDKTAFDFKPPQRGDLAILRVPHDAARPYLKRIAGLPLESVRIVGGDLVIDGELVRKNAGDAFTTGLCIYRHDAPPEGGWGRRWLAVPADDRATVDAGGLSLFAGSVPQYRWLVYRNIAVDSVRELAVQDGAALLAGGPGGRPAEVHDFRVSFTVHAAGTGTFAVALSDGRDRAFVQFPCPASDEGVRVLIGDGFSRGVPNTGLVPGRSHAVQVSFFDRRVCVRLDGDDLLPAIDLPAVAEREGVSRPLRFGADRLDVRLTAIELFHDLHITETGLHGIGRDCRLGPDEYFLLGDCSAVSDDSRTWPTPGVKRSALIGRPMLRHHASRPCQFLGVDWGRLGPVR